MQNKTAGDLLGVIQSLDVSQIEDCYDRCNRSKKGASKARDELESLELNGAEVPAETRAGVGCGWGAWDMLLLGQDSWAALPSAPR